MAHRGTHFCLKSIEIIVKKKKFAKNEKKIMENVIFTYYYPIEYCRASHWKM